MKRIAFIAAGAAVVTVGLSGTPASAQANRTFVSGHGSNSNPCSLSAPCRSFSQAYSQTNAGGEITVLDPAGYGSVTITKAISIINDGVGEAGVTTASAVDAININAGTNDVINLRGLTLVGGGVGNNGVNFTAGGTVNIQNCVIRGFTQFGFIAFSTGSGNFNISDTIVSNNGNTGILIEPNGTTTPTTASFVRVQAIGNGIQGFFLQGANSTGALRAIAVDTLASGNAGAGFEAVSGTGQAPTIFTLVNSKSVKNSFGLSALSQNATMFITESTVSGNSSLGYDAENGGVIKSYGDNSIVDTAHFGSLTPVALQ